MYDFILLIVFIVFITLEMILKKQIWKILALFLAGVFLKMINPKMCMFLFFFFRWDVVSYSISDYHERKYHTP